MRRIILSGFLHWKVCVHSTSKAWSWSLHSASALPQYVLNYPIAYCVEWSTCDAQQQHCSHWCPYTLSWHIMHGQEIHDHDLLSSSFSATPAIIHSTALAVAVAVTSPNRFGFFFCILNCIFMTRGRGDDAVWEMTNQNIYQKTSKRSAHVDRRDDYFWNNSSKRIWTDSFAAETL